MPRFGMSMAMVEEEEGVRYVNDGPYFTTTNNDNSNYNETSAYPHDTTTTPADADTGYSLGYGSTPHTGQSMTGFKPKPGTYDACGISACGSLRNEGSAGHTHGSFFGTPDVAREIQLMRLSITTPSPVAGQGLLGN